MYGKNRDRLGCKVSVDQVGDLGVGVHEPYALVREQQSVQKRVPGLDCVNEVVQRRQDEALFHLAELDAAWAVRTGALGAPVAGWCRSEPLGVTSIGRKDPVIMFVIAPAADLQMLRIDAAGIVTSMANNVLECQSFLVQNAEDESVGGGLAATEAGLATGLGRGHQTRIGIDFGLGPKNLDD